MRKNLLAIIAFIMIIAVIVMAVNVIKVTKQKYSKKPEETTEVCTVPERGTVLHHEEYKGMEVPIIADGIGGSYRWVADVPWDKFSIEEKFDMTRVNGGYLSIKDLAEIWFKFGEWKKTGTFYGIKIFKIESDNPK